MKASSNAAYVPAPPSPANINYTVNGLNQVTTGASVSWTHDARGNATAVGANTFGYDAENRLTDMNSSTVKMT